MVDGAVTVSDGVIATRGKGGGEKGLGGADGLLQPLPQRQMRRDCSRQGAAGAMRVAGGDARC